MMVSPEIVVGVRMGDLFEVVRGCLNDRQAAVLSKVYFGITADRVSYAKPRQGERVMHASVLHGQRQRIDIAGHGVNHGHHETWRTTSPLHNDHISRKVWTRAFLAIPQYAPALLDALANSCAIPSLLRRYDLWRGRFAFVDLCGRIVLKTRLPGWCRLRRQPCHRQHRA